MNAPATFNFEGATVRVITINELPWFVAADVCEVLGISNSRDALARLDDDEKDVGTADTLGGHQHVNVINESGLYSLTLTSRKPEAKRFKKWVTSEVLPSIRKTGQYTTATAPAFQIPTTLSGALRLAAEQAEQIEQQAQALALAAPKVEFVDRYVTADSGAKGLREVCKILKANERHFTAFLNARQIMYRLAGGLTPYAPHIDAGRFVVKTGEANGRAFSTAKFTPKGVEWIAGEWAKWRLIGETA
jgi:anti-repressor protein